MFYLYLILNYIQIHSELNNFMESMETHFPIFIFKNKLIIPMT